MSSYPYVPVLGDNEYLGWHSAYILSRHPHHQNVHDVLQAIALYLSAASGWKMVWKLQQACRQDIRTAGWQQHH